MRGIQLVRLLKTIDMISSRSGASPERIADELEVSTRTVYRLLNVIEELGFIIENVDDPLENRTRKRLDRTFHQQVGPLNLPDIRFTAQELIALHLLQGEARVYRGSRIGENIDSAFAKIAAFGPGELCRKIERLRSLALLDSKMSKSLEGKEEIVDQLSWAMLENHTCRIRYHSFHDDRHRTFLVDPLHFFEYQGGLYLFVHTPAYGDIRVLAAERILEVQPTGTAFTYPAGFDPHEKLRQAFGLVYDDPVEVEIRFSASQARYIRERTWAEGQRIIEQEDGSLILQMRTSGWIEIKKWLLGYGRDAELLKPETLRRELLAEAEAMAALYRR